MAFPAQPTPETTDGIEGGNSRWLEPEGEGPLSNERTRALLGISNDKFLCKLDMTRRSTTRTITISRAPSC